MFRLLCGVSLAAGSVLRADELNIGLGSSLQPEKRVYEQDQPSRRVLLEVPVQIDWGIGERGKKNLLVIEGGNPFPAIERLSTAMALDKGQLKSFRNTVLYRLDFNGRVWQHRVFVLLLTALDALLIPQLVSAAIGHSPGAEVILVTNGFSLCSEEEERVKNMVVSASVDGSRLTVLSFPHEFVGHAVAINAAVESAPANSIIAILPPQALLRSREKTECNGGKSEGVSDRGVAADIFVSYNRIARQLNLTADDGSGACFVMTTALPRLPDELVPVRSWSIAAPLPLLVLERSALVGCAGVGPVPTGNGSTVDTHAAHTPH
jgi:hypothetical protein